MSLVGSCAKSKTVPYVQSARACLSDTAQVCILAFSFIHADNDPLEFLPACMDPFQRTLSRTFGATGQRLNAIYSRFVLHTFPEPAVTHVQTIYFRSILLGFGLCSRPFTFTSLIFSCFFYISYNPFRPPPICVCGLYAS